MHVSLPTYFIKLSIFQWNLFHHKDTPLIIQWSTRHYVNILFNPFGPLYLLVICTKQGLLISSTIYWDFLSHWRIIEGLHIISSIVSLNIPCQCSIISAKHILLVVRIWNDKKNWTLYYFTKETVVFGHIFIKETMSF